MDEFSLCCYSFIPFPHEEKNPRFALGADVYTHVPQDKLKKYNDKNHALAIWLDIVSQEWVVRKEYRNRIVLTISLKAGMRGVMLSSGQTINFQEVYRGKDFQEALKICTIFSHKYWDSEMQWIECTHQGESHCCKKYKDNYAYRGI